MAPWWRGIRRGTQTVTIDDVAIQNGPFWWRGKWRVDAWSNDVVTRGSRISLIIKKVKWLTLEYNIILLLILIFFYCSQSESDTWQPTATLAIFVYLRLEKIPKKMWKNSEKFYSSWRAFQLFLRNLLASFFFIFLHPNFSKIHKLHLIQIWILSKFHNLSNPHFILKSLNFNLSNFILNFKIS